MMSPLITAACLIGALCWGTAAAQDSVQDGNGTPDLKLLFVGNSLLYYNGGVYKVVVVLLVVLKPCLPSKVELKERLSDDDLRASIEALIMPAVINGNVSGHLMSRPVRHTDAL